MTIVQYDAIPEEFANVPANPPAVGSYIDGYGGYPQAVTRWPKAHHLSITIHGGRARCGDFEAGAMSIADAPGWYQDHAIHDQGLPILYASASNVQALIAAMNRAGIPRSSYLIWSAHIGWTHQAADGAHICGPGTCGYPQADGTQHAFTVNGRTCDQSILSDRFYTAPPAPRPHGIARASLALDLARGHWHVHPEPGKVTFGHTDRWCSVEIQINQRTGEWRARPLPYNAPPLGH